MSNSEPRLKRKARIRRKMAGTESRTRLSVYKSLKHIYAQVVDDSTGKTLAFASSLSKELKDQNEGDKKADAKRVGKLIAEKCKSVNVEAVVFGRNEDPYQSTIPASAQGARHT